MKLVADIIIATKWNIIYKSHESLQEMQLNVYKEQESSTETLAPIWKSTSNKFWKAQVRKDLFLSWNMSVKQQDPSGRVYEQPLGSSQIPIAFFRHAGSWGGDSKEVQKRKISK